MPSSHSFITLAIDSILFSKSGTLVHKKEKQWRDWFFRSGTPVCHEGQVFGLFSFCYSKPGKSPPTPPPTKCSDSEEVSRRKGISSVLSVKWSTVTFIWPSARGIRIEDEAGPRHEVKWVIKSWCEPLRSRAQRYPMYYNGDRKDLQGSVSVTEVASWVWIFFIVTGLYLNVCTDLGVADICCIFLLAPLSLTVTTGPWFDWEELILSSIPRALTKKATPGWSTWPRLNQLRRAPYLQPTLYSLGMNTLPKSCQVLSMRPNPGLWSAL